MKHTPEPWRVDKQSPQEKWPGIEAADNTSIVIFGTDDDDGGVRAETEEQALANADRIVTCVNALAGLNPEAIKDVVEALEAVNSSSLTYPHGIAKLMSAFDQVEAALAKLKQTTP